MTEEQKLLIKKLRYEGIGYKAIGLQLGLSRDVVRNFCKKNGMDGYGKRIKLARKMEEKPDECRLCGKPIFQNATGRPRRYCCERHRREWWKLNQDLINKKPKSQYELVCEQCGKTYISYGNKNRKFCGRECYVAYRFYN